MTYNATSAIMPNVSKRHTTQQAEGQEGTQMRVYEIKVYSKAGLLICKDYKYLADNQAAKIAAEEMEADYSATYSEWQRVR